MTKASPPGWKKTRSIAIRKALRFLLAQRSADGWWRDFETLAGTSDEWVTAYTACRLARLPGGRRVAGAALRLLLTRERAVGWGYSRIVPADCDSTVWVCRLIELLGRTNLPSYRRATRWLRASASRDGLPTYPSDDAIRRFTGVPSRWSFAGWTAPHVCVTAAAASLEAFSRNRGLRQALRRARQPDGSWSGYWWTDRAYPTMLAADAVGQDEHVRHWAHASGEDSPFAIACRIRCGANLYARLLEMQEPDGGWPSSATLRVPPPDAEDPARRARVTCDHNRIFVTATAIWALYESPAR